MVAPIAMYFLCLGADGMHHMNRRALLRRAGTGAGALALLGVAAEPAGAATDVDLSNVRLLCSCKRLEIYWLTQWLNSSTATPTGDARDLLLAIRVQDEGHYKLLAPLLGATAPTDDDFTFTIPKGALRSSSTAAGFSLDLEELVVGIGVGAVSTTKDTGIAASLAAVLASDAQHAGAFSVMNGSAPNPDGFVAAVNVQDAGDQLSQFLS
jgi:Ferritin-like domain